MVNGSEQKRRYLFRYHRNATTMQEGLPRMVRLHGGIADQHAPRVIRFGQLPASKWNVWRRK